MGSSGINSRLAEWLAVETAVTEIAKKAGCHTLIHAGDWFDRKNVVDAVCYAEGARILEERVAAGIEVYLLKGNHDEAGGGVRNTLETLGRLPGVHVIAKPEVFWLRNRVAKCCAIPYDEKASRQAAIIRELANDQGGTVPRLLLSHLELVGAKTGSEYTLPGKFAVADLCPNNFERIVLGHVHEPQGYYIGSVWQRNFTDIGSERSVLLMDEQTLEFSRVRVPGPRFRRIEVDTPDDLIALAETIGREDYVKVVLRTSAVTGKDVDELLDGRAKGWQWHRERDTVSVPRISPTTSAWPDVIAAYVAQLDLDGLDPGEVTAKGLELLRKAGDG